MIAIIAGGRDYRLTTDDIAKLDALPIDTVVHGDCRGVDKQAAEWAAYHGYVVWAKPADWAKHGKAAGPIRNREMAKIADICVLFPGGRGTDDMFNAAVDAGLTIYDYRNQPAIYIEHAHLVAVVQVALSSLAKDDSVPPHKMRASLTEIRKQVDDLIEAAK